MGNFKLTGWTVLALMLACRSERGEGEDDCVLRERQCFGDIVQACIAEATEQRTRWMDVEDCTVNDDAVCVESTRSGGATTAQCAPLAADAGAAAR